MHFASDNHCQGREFFRQKNSSIMDNIIRAKLKLCDKVKTELEDSKDQEIIEDTEPPFWGRGKNNEGHNMLGNIMDALS